MIVAYEDDPDGTMVEEVDGGGQFTAVVLRPRVTLESGSDVAMAEALHRTAHARCFVARSFSFAVACEPATCVTTGWPEQG